jgi:adenine-specific DNA-methyltransferase
MAVADLVASNEAILDRAEERRGRMSLALDEGKRSDLGQFFTPSDIATLMTGMLEPVPGGSLRVLDPGAGSGALTSALVKTICEWPAPPARLDVTVVDIDPRLEPALQETLADCESLCAEQGVAFTGAVQIGDFLKSTAREMGSDEKEGFDVAILNPPYRKIRSDSDERTWARAFGAEVPNLYAAFLAGTTVSLAPGGQMVAITPRSFTNGTYFRRFRRFLLERVAIAKLHVFDSRDLAFRGDGVLQENLVMHLIRRRSDDLDRVLVSASQGPSEPIRSQGVARSAVVDVDDPEAFIRLPVDRDHTEIAGTMAGLPARLGDLGIAVSTGPVVDFRLRDHLRRTPGGDDAVPLLYPASVRASEITWPAPKSRKPCAISRAAHSWLVPDGNYVLVRRLTAKEESRRVVAALLREGQLGCDEIGLENHLNYFHGNGNGLDRRLGLGLTKYLNSSFVDRYIRLFSGHTQINASDLRALRYPSLAQLCRLPASAFRSHRRGPRRRGGSPAHNLPFRAHPLRHTVSV